MVKIGIIGTGNMGNQHAKALEAIKGTKIIACCDINEQRSTAFANTWKIPHVYTDYKQMLASENLDALYNITVDALHAPISIAALKKNIAVLCEKPLATTLAEAKKMTLAAKASSAISMINFTYRNAPAVQGAAKAIAAGKIGRIMHVEASYLQSWLVQAAWGDWKTDPTWTWRLSTAHGSGGALADVGCHIYDLVTFLCGDITTMACTTKTFDKGFKNNRIGEFVLDANDSFVSTVEFAHGGVGTIHGSRWATGKMNALSVRIFGDTGALDIDLDRSADSFKMVSGTAACTSATWETISCKPVLTNSERFIRAVSKGVADQPDFDAGLKVQAYLHYSQISSNEKKTIAIKI